MELIRTAANTHTHRTHARNHTHTTQLPPQPGPQTLPPNSCLRLPSAVGPRQGQLLLCIKWSRLIFYSKIDRHSKTEWLWTIQNQDAFGIRAPTLFDEYLNRFLRNICFHSFGWGSGSHEIFQIVLRSLACWRWIFGWTEKLKIVQYY